jgi:hypothetical protein
MEPANQSVHASGEAELHQRAPTEDEQLIEAAGLYIEVPPLAERVPDHEPAVATPRTSHAKADDAAPVLLSKSPTGGQEHLPITNTASGNRSHIQMAAEGGRNKQHVPFSSRRSAHKPGTRNVIRSISGCQ